MAFDSDLWARRFHEAYERLAPEYGYKTREASAKPWDEVPEGNRQLMQATVSELLLATFTEVIEALEDAEHQLRDWMDYDATYVDESDATVLERIAKARALLEPPKPSSTKIVLDTIVDA